VSGGNAGDVLTARSARTVPAETGILLTVALGTMLVPLNSTMISVALPRLIADFHSDLASAGWLVTGYLIAMASLQPVAGNLGDRLGRRPLVLGGLVWFGAASLGAGLAPDLPLLILFRIQQAVAGALVFPNGIALLREIAPPGRLGGRLGVVMGALPLAAAVGPLLSGLLLAFGGWRAIFLVNLPLVIVPLVLGWRSLPRRPRRSSAGRFDLMGGVLLSLLLIGAAWALNRGFGGSDGIVAVAVASAAAVLFVAQELRHPKPVVELRLFRNTQFLAANGGVALSNLAMYVTLFALPILLTRKGGWTSAQIGLALATLTMTMTMFASSPLGGRLTDRRGARLPASTGLAFMTASLVPFALGAADLSATALVLALLGVGTGLGLATVPLQTAALEAVDASMAGLVSGMFSTSRYLGSIAGISLLAGPLQPAASGFGGFGTIFVVLTGAAAASAALALALPSRAHAESRVEPAEKAVGAVGGDSARR
jgi:EmrB/QacA subfamily drug resistance transporter